MERRSFLLGLLALAAGSASTLQPDGAQAAPVALPDGAPVDWAQEQRVSRPQLHYRRMPREQPVRERRRICETVKSRHGPPRRRCRWVRS